MASCLVSPVFLSSLPPALCLLASSLPPEDQEVLAYLICCCSFPLPLPVSPKKKRRNKFRARVSCVSSSAILSPQQQLVNGCGCKEGLGCGGRVGKESLPCCSLLRGSPCRRNSSLQHPRKVGAGKKGGCFGCDCFECYKVFWSRWDTSPNRELIHRVIDGFEDHLAEQLGNIESKKNGERRSRARRKESGNECLGKNSPCHRPESPKDITLGNRIDFTCEDMDPENTMCAESNCNQVKSKYMDDVLCAESIITSQCTSEDILMMLNSTEQVSGLKNEGQQDSGSGRDHHLILTNTKNAMPINLEDEKIPGIEEHSSPIKPFALKTGFLYPYQGGSRRKLMSRVFPDAIGFVAKRMLNVWNSGTDNSAIALY
eukprot:c34369_g1_i1 orf=61-1176(-)